MNFKNKLSKPLDALPIPVKGSKEDARYEMLVSLLASGQVKIEVSDWAQEDLKCLVAGKWMEEDPETADIYAIKLFGSPVSSWDEKAVKEYKKTYKNSVFYRNLKVEDAVAAAKVKYLVKKALPVVAVAACAVAIFMKAKKK